MCRYQIIEKNTRVRLKIVGTRVDATEIVRPLLVSNYLYSFREVCYRNYQRRSSWCHRLSSVRPAALLS